MNAIVNRMMPSLRGCTMYTTVFPCNKCATLIVQSGINKLVYAKEVTNDEDKISRKILDHAEVWYK